MLTSAQTYGLQPILQKVQGNQVSRIYDSEKCLVKGKVYQLQEVARADHEKRLAAWKEGRKF